MSDDNAAPPGEQAANNAEATTAAPNQPAKAPQATTPPEGYIEKGRFDGAIRKVEQLTLESREINSQLEQKSSEIEQLKAQLGIKDTEKTVAIGERDKQLETALQANQTLTSENAALKALELKVKVAKELGHPELISIADTIPNLTDEEALKTVMGDIMRFAETQVTAREEQLMAGVGPAPGPGNEVVDSPQTAEAWEEHINTMVLGSAERGKAMDKYGDWLERKHNQS